jgi:hypothetical protein
VEQVSRARIQLGNRQPALICRRLIMRWSGFGTFRDLIVRFFNPRGFGKARLGHFFLAIRTPVRRTCVHSHARRLLCLVCALRSVHWVRDRPIPAAWSVRCRVRVRKPARPTQPSVLLRLINRCCLTGICDNQDLAADRLPKLDTPLAVFTSEKPRDLFRRACDHLSEMKNSLCQFLLKGYLHVSLPVS